MICSALRLYSSSHPGLLFQQVDSQEVVSGYLMSSILKTRFNHFCLHCANFVSFTLFISSVVTVSDEGLIWDTYI
jgi:hypothetical protein